MAVKTVKKRRTLLEVMMLYIELSPEKRKSVYAEALRELKYLQKGKYNDAEVHAKITKMHNAFGNFDWDNETE